MGTDVEPVPVTGLAANFSPIPLMAPPPLGSEIVGANELFCRSPFVSGLFSWAISSSQAIDGLWQDSLSRSFNAKAQRRRGAR